MARMIPQFLNDGLVVLGCLFLRGIRHPILGRTRTQFFQRLLAILTLAHMGFGGCLIRLTEFSKTHELELFAQSAPFQFETPF